MERTVYNHSCQRTDPAALEVTWSEFPYKDEHKVMTWERLNDKLGYGVDVNQMLQRFVWSPTNKAQMFRIVYHNKTYSESGVNVGYQISNERSYWDTRLDL